MDHPILSVVCPLYNEEGNIDALKTRLIGTCRSLGLPFEIIFINDGSRDATLEHLIALSREVPEIRVLSFARNFGVMAGYRAGIVSARGDAVVVIDGDLQDPPELIPELIAKWKSGSHVVYGQRRGTGNSGPKKLLSSLYYWLIVKFSGVAVPPHVGTFGLMDRSIVDRMKGLEERQFFFAVQRAWLGGKQDAVLYDRVEREHGSSRVGLKRQMRFAWTAVTSISNAPLRAVSAFALCASFVLFLIGATAIGIRLFTDLATPNWATITTLVGFVGFVQSLVLAVIAEYIAVIFEEVKGRPLYYVQEEYRNGDIV